MKITEALKAENKRLQEALEQRTSELTVKNRELEIEASLEKVRSRSLAMQKSEELAEASVLLEAEIRKLGIENWGCAFHIYDEKTTSEKPWDLEWFTSMGGLLPCYKTPREKVFLKYYEESKKRNPLFIQDFGPDVIKEHYDYLKTIPVLGDALTELYNSGVPLPERQIDHIAFFNHGHLLFITYKPVPEAHAIFIRFANVFNQAYTRFLDLQKAEAQAREAEIELALERVRSRSLAMHATSELQDVIHTVHQELIKLEIGIFGGSFIAINSEIEDELHCWGAGGTADTSDEVHIPYFDKPFYTNLVKGLKGGPAFFTEEFTQEEKKEFFTFLFTKEPWSNLKANEKKEILSSPGGYTRSCSVSLHTSIFIINQLGKKFSADENDILKRFGKVFEQSYTRFLDLQKAEAQAKEAQIEVAIERVRAQSMAMHHPDDLDKVNKEILSQLKWLQIQGLTGVTFYLIDEKGWVKAWDFSSPGNTADQSNYTLQFDSNKHEMLGFPFKTLRQTDLDYFVADYPLEKLEKAVYEFEEIDPAIAKIVREALSTGMLTHQWTAWCRISNGLLGIDLVSPPSEDTKAIVLKMASAFNQAYTRFLDLQKAEAQARDAQIEAALERVRSRSLAMQKSEELAEVATLLFQQVKVLGVPQFHCGFSIFEIDDKEFTWYAGSPNGDILPPSKIPLTEHPVFISFNESRKRGDELFVYEKEGEYQAGHYRYMLSLPVVGEVLQSMLDAGLTFPTFQIDHLANFSHGNLTFTTAEHFPEAHDIFKRFAKVFEQTYTRFLDLQKAEAQAREAHIEAALERVRAKTMGMRSSDELLEIVDLLYAELSHLDVALARVVLLTINPETKGMLWWMASPEKEIKTHGFLVPPNDLPMTLSMLEGWENKRSTWSYHLEGKDKKAYDKFLFAKSELAQLPEEVQIAMSSAKQMHVSGYCNNFGLLTTSTLEPLSDNNSNLLTRFGLVFEQTYTRFLDLQKAEAQAREAQIEAALERVRAYTMSMNKSNDLRHTVSAIFKELDKLDLKTMRCAIGIINGADRTVNVWTTTATNDGTEVTFSGNESMDVHPLMQGVFESWKKQEDYYYTLEGDDLIDYYNTMGGDNYKLPEAAYGAKVTALDTHYYYCTFFPAGGIAFFKEFPFTNDLVKVIRRFASAFSLAYKRFEDLKFSEAQAREAKIEASLERVRSKTMGMHSSLDVGNTMVLLFEELEILGIKANRNGIIILDEEEHGEIWTAQPNINNEIELMAWELDMRLHDLTKQVYKAWKNKNSGTVYPLIGDDLKAYYETLNKNTDIPVKFNLDTFPEREWCYTFNFNEGFIYLFTDEEIIQEHEQIPRRFAKVFEQTYTRFLDLQKAEEREKEAIKQSSLDRVRAEIASMRNTEDLQRITPLIWRELLTLGVPFFRCGLMIVDEKEEKVRFYLSTPDGNPLAALNLDFESSDISSNGIKNWRIQQPYIAHWNKEEFLAFTKMLIDQQQIVNPTTYQGGEAPLESLTLQFIPFPQGMLYVGSAEDLSLAQIDLVQNLANAFSVAYARYEDFKQLEDAKSQIEHTLSELKSAQSQLIQSEKMASLGELTAGIAHEIQNPLNFVNNFSEVSSEMFDELMEEIEKGDMEEVKALSADIKENLVKINHHGKRADSIVKGMLEHSRSSSGEKSLTDINALADEFLRLSYHGIRAKDKSFNSDFKLELDPLVPKINIIGKDIGRVILNLVNNAFYAVHEKAKSTPQPPSFEPTVIVKTKAIKSPSGDLGVELSVKDNGSGIPDSVKDKIFQPFFTTKPTGSGTGLGLSLSYDIVKAHGGELRVESKEGQGTEFTIFLPLV